MDNYTIGNNIRRWRLFRGYQQTVLADKIEVSVVTLSKYENGRSDIPVSTLTKIASILQVDLNTLWVEEGSGLSAN